MPPRQTGPGEDTQVIHRDRGSGNPAYFKVEVPQHPLPTATRIGWIYGLTVALQIVLVFAYGRAGQSLSEYLGLALIVVIVATPFAFLGIGIDKPDGVGSRRLMWIVVLLCTLTALADMMAVKNFIDF